MATAFRDSELLTVEQFLKIDFGDQRAELDNGVIRMMTGGTIGHAWLQRNVLTALSVKLSGSSCQPFGSDTGLKTTPDGLRYPDVAVYCGKSFDDVAEDKALEDPKFVVEILSPNTSRVDERNKLPEYQSLPSVDAVLYVDPQGDRLRLLRRDGAQTWIDRWLDADEDVVLPTLDITLTRAEIFAR